MVGVKFLIRTKGIPQTRKYLEKVAKGLKNEPPKTLKRLLIQAQAKARSIAPIDTGAMIKRITYHTTGRDKGMLISQKPLPNQEAYNVIMHLNPRLKRWRGDPQFMYTTGEWMKVKFRQDMAKTVGAIVSKS